MKTWYRVDFAPYAAVRVSTVQVLRETAHSLIIPASLARRSVYGDTEQTVRKDAPNRAYFADLTEAARFAEAKIQDRIDRANRDIGRARDNSRELAGHLRIMAQAAEGEGGEE